MVTNRFRRYRIKVPLNIWAEIPFNLTHVRYLQFKQWGELNQKPSPISRLFPHLEAIQNHTKYQKKTGLPCLFYPTVPSISLFESTFWQMNPHEILACCRMFLPLGSKPVSPISVLRRCRSSRSWPFENWVDHPPVPSNVASMKITLFFMGLLMEKMPWNQILLDLPACYFLSTSHDGIYPEPEMRNPATKYGFRHGMSLFHYFMTWPSSNICATKNLPGNTNVLWSPNPLVSCPFFDDNILPLAQDHHWGSPDHTVSKDHHDKCRTSQLAISNFSRSWSHSLLSTPDKLKPLMYNLY